MQLKNNLYTIVDKSITESPCSFTIALNKAHIIYQAHFPGEPITPGVCIVQIGKELLEEYLEDYFSIKLALEIVKVKNVKFISIISPIDASRVEYKIKKLDVLEDFLRVKAQIEVSASGELKCKMSLELRKQC